MLGAFPETTYCQLQTIFCHVFTKQGCLTNHQECAQSFSRTARALIDVIHQFSLVSRKMLEALDPT